MNDKLTSAIPRPPWKPQTQQAPTVDITAFIVPRGTIPDMLPAGVCGYLFNPPLSAQKFKEWAKLVKLEPDGCKLDGGGFPTVPLWRPCRVRLARERNRNTFRPKQGKENMRHRFNVDTCHYCKRKYHPMPRYTRNGELIYVCHIRFDESGIDLDWKECREKAEADGYTLRLDLTPKR